MHFISMSILYHMSFFLQMSSVFMFSDVKLKNIETHYKVNTHIYIKCESKCWRCCSYL